MLTSGLKMLPAANPGARSLPAGNERRGVCKQGAIGEDLDPVGLGPHLSKRGSRDELPVPTAALGPRAAELWQGPRPTPVGICPWPVSPHALRPPSPVSSPRTAAGSLREATRQRKCVGGEDPLFHAQHQGGLCSRPHPLTPSSPQPDWGPKPGSCGQGAWESCPRSAAGSPHQAACAPPRGGLSRSRGRDRAASPEDKSVRGRQPSVQRGLDAPPAQCPSSAARPGLPSTLARVSTAGTRPGTEDDTSHPGSSCSGPEQSRGHLPDATAAPPPCAHVRVRLRVRCPPRAGHSLLCQAGCSPFSSPLLVPGGNRPGPRL